MDNKERIEELIKQIEYHSNRYYNMDEPEISDYEYDSLMQELKQLEKENPELVSKNSPTQKVGGSAKREAGVLVKHNVPMLSLQDVFSKEDVYHFVESVQKELVNPVFVVEYKIDGLSVALRYEDGELKLAVTRGDGIIQGEDVTENIKVIKDVKKKLKDPVPYIEIRGEVYMSNEAFQQVNEKQELLGKKVFANPRNCAAGTLRQLDSSITKERNLSLFIFNVQDTKGITFTTHTEGYEFLKKQGIKTIENIKICKTADEVWDAIQEIGENRGKLGYDIDGAVVKLDNLADRVKLGTTSKVPKWAIAYKYPPEEKETILQEIELSVGRTGRITPTAVFHPIRLCGTNVERATLHNQDFIDDLDVRIGDTIIVYKSGEIIPKVKTVVKEKRPVGAAKYVMPEACPVCGAKTVREKDTANLCCTNADCPAQLERHLINFVGRDAMDIKGFGESYIVELINKDYLHDIADIYRLKDVRDKLIEEGIIGKEKNTDKLLENIEKSKDNEPQRLLTGFGIRNVGKALARTMMLHFKNMDAIMQASMEELKEVSDIGEVSALAILDFFANPNNKRIIEELRELGVNLSLAESNLPDSKFNGITFVITGTLPTMDRKDAANLIENNGGKVSSSVSKNTNYVLAGENAGSKLTKANELGVEVIDEEQLLKMING